MANKSIHMSKLRHILKLYCQGRSKLHISSTTGLSRNTLKKYLHTKADGTYLKEITKMEKQDLLIIDDFGIQPLDQQNNTHGDY